MEHRCSARDAAVGSIVLHNLANTPSPRPFHFKLIGCPAVPVGGLHAADGLVGAGVDAPGGGIQDAVADMDAEDLADDEAVIADLQDAPAFAFKTDGCLYDAGRTDGGAGDGGESGVL